MKYLSKCHKHTALDIEMAMLHVCAHGNVISFAGLIVLKK